MDGFFLFAAWFLASVGAALLYLTAPKQQLLIRPLPRWTRVGCFLFFIGATVLFSKVFSPVTSVFSLIVSVMLFWTAGPLAVALWRRRAA